MHIKVQIGPEALACMGNITWHASCQSDLNVPSPVNESVVSNKLSFCGETQIQSQLRPFPPERRALISRARPKSTYS